MNAGLRVLFCSVLVVLPLALMPTAALTFAVTWLPLTLFLGLRALKAAGGFVAWLCMICVTWLVLFNAKVLLLYATGQ